MKPDTFTLGNLFEMGLSAFTEEIGAIVSGAGKELAIESGVLMVEENQTTVAPLLIHLSKHLLFIELRQHVQLTHHPKGKKEQPNVGHHP